MSVAIEVQHLAKTYVRRVRANRDISFQIRTGESVGVLGPNGSGKTTLLRQLYGELRSDSGTVRILDHVVPNEITGIKNRLGVMPQDARPRTDLTVFSHLYYAMLLRGFDRGRARTLTENAIDELDLKENRGTYIADLSGGTQRKVLLALSLAHSPEVLLLDEPTVGLDILFRNRIWQTLKASLAEGRRTLLITSHYPQDIETLCTRIICLKEGTILYDGAISGLIARTGTGSLEQAYLSLMEGRDYGN